MDLNSVDIITPCTTTQFISIEHGSMVSAHVKSIASVSRVIISFLFHVSLVSSDNGKLLADRQICAISHTDE